MELKVAVAPVQRPFAAGIRIPQARDQDAAPFGPEALPPWDSALDDRQGPIGDFYLQTHLVPCALGYACRGPFAHAMNISLGEHLAQRSQRPRLDL